MSIEVNQLTKVYGSQKAVNQISFAIPKGQIVGFLGPNGAGKSTTMKMLTCFIPPSEGSAQVCGKDIVENSLEVRRKVGYLPEHNPLYLDMYVKEYLQFAGELSKTPDIKKRVAEVIELTNLGNEKHKQIGQLSKGYRQRVGLAQAIIHNPEVLILDEPTSGLDPNQVIEIRDLIKTLGAEKTIMLSTHIMQEVEALCDRAIIINKGNIVADDKLSDLQNAGKGNVTVRIQFTRAVDVNDLRKIEGVKEVSNPNGFVYLINGNNENLRTSVSHFALSNNLEVLELVALNNSLEEVFRKVTGNVGNL